MLPSMPILFTSNSQDVFLNKIGPSTSFVNHHSISKPVINPEPPVTTSVVERVAQVTKDIKNNNGTVGKAQEDPLKANSNVFETALIKSYFMKVKSRFSSCTSLPTNKFVQFQNILRSFDPNAETPEMLFQKIEELFGEEHNDIVEEFLLFLKPGQAVKVGRFMDRFMLVQITGFIELLQSTFARKPTVLRKILRAITTGINSGSSEEMKTRVLPHLRSNARLTQMFKSLFPDERPPENLYETGVDMLNESFLTCDKGYDVWEFEDEKDTKRKLDTKGGVEVTYLHGRVFLQHGRMLRPARVTFPYSKEPYRVHARRLAPAQSHSSPSNSDEEKSPSKRNTKNISKIPPKKAKKQLASPTKNCKDVNDNTKLKDSSMTTSPKVCKKSQNTKNKKRDNENKEILKRERKDKSQACQKETRVKQTKIVDPICLEFKKVKSDWTRDEDKTMLQVLKGEAGSKQVFCRIKQLLPHRSPTEIKERFCHVMTLLQQMAVGQVT